jgi:predicted dienelactone hydrolase
VIIFSHGLHGCATQSGFLMEAFAAAGYLVFAPDHRDAGCRGGPGEPVAPFRRPERWNEASHRDRADDIRRLIESIGMDERYAPRADFTRLGLAGHSLGGYTVVGLAGAWPSWKLPRIGAVLALAPYVAPFVEHRTLTGLSSPVMYQVGTPDRGITRAVRKAGGAYDRSPVPKYYIEFERAGHFAWADIDRTDRAAIVRYSVAFMNRYVKGESEDPVLKQALADVVWIRYATLEGSGAAGPQANSAARAWHLFPR